MIEITKVVLKDSYAVKLTAQEAGVVVGWAYLYVIFNDRHVEPYGIVENVYVEQEYRGRGFGSTLIRDAIQEAKDRGCYKIIMQSRHGKPEVHALYKKFGFLDHGINFRMDLVESEVKQRD